ncbi:MAG: bacteriocin [Ktedonobacteraceae bacterium]|nr:bacteriocin [Ktedonobacteraceae bacterium]
MSIEEIIKAWKSEENGEAPESPVGLELSEEELQEITGGLPCTILSCGGMVSCLLIASASYTTTTY